MSDAEEEQYNNQSFAQSGEDREEEDEYRGSRHGSSHKHNPDRRRTDEEEEEEEEEDNEDDEDEDEDEEGVARGDKRQKVCSRTVQHDCSILNTEVFVIASADINAPQLTASLMLKPRSMRTKTRKKRTKSMVEVSFYDSFTSHSNAIALQTSSSPNMKAMVTTRRVRGDHFTMPVLIDAKGSSMTKIWHA